MGEEEERKEVSCGMAFNFADELAKFSKKHVLALRQASAFEDQKLTAKQVKSFIDAADRSLVDTCLLKEKTVKKLEQNYFVNRAESIVEEQKQQQYEFKTI